MAYAPTRSKGLNYVQQETACFDEDITLHDLTDLDVTNEEAAAQ